MELRVKGWESKGLRCPDIKIDIAGPSEFAPVVLLQMPNGTGKTTTLDMIRAALTGEARYWSPEKIREYGRLGDVATTGQFLLHLTVDQKPLTFEMSFDFVDGDMQYKTTSPSLGGVELDWKPPSDIHRFLNDKFVGLFVFDGEFAHKLLKPEDAEAERALDALCQLYLLDECAGRAEEAWLRAVQKGGPKTRTSLKVWQDRVSNLQHRIHKLEQRRSEATARITELNTTISELSQKMEERLASEAGNRQELEASRATETQAEQQVKDINARVMQIIRQPHLLHQSFTDALRALKQQFDRVQLPTSTSRQFFLELAEETTCICGRPLDEHTREVILKQAEHYLGEEISGILNALKGDIDLHMSQIHGDGASNDAGEAAVQLNEAVNAWHQASSRRLALELQILQGGADDIKEERARVDNLVKERDDLKDLLEMIESPAQDTDDDRAISFDDKAISLPHLKKQVAIAKRKVAEISDTVELRDKTQILQEVCRAAKDRAREAIRQDLIKICNQRLDRILSKAPVRIANIGRSLQLQNQSGASVGQTLAVGYTFLASLLERGQHGFPLIVDSPANPIDIGVRREIGLMVPELCKQFIAFTISSEREGFVSSLERSCGGQLRYLTLFRKTPGTKALQQNLPNTDVVETENAVLVEGKEYFENFDLDREPEE